MALKSEHVLWPRQMSLKIADSPPYRPHRIEDTYLISKWCPLPYHLYYEEDPYTDAPIHNVLENTTPYTIRIMFLTTTAQLSEIIQSSFPTFFSSLQCRNFPQSDLSDCAKIIALKVLNCL